MYNHVHRVCKRPEHVWSDLHAAYESLRKSDGLPVAILLKARLSSQSCDPAACAAAAA